MIIYVYTQYATVYMLKGASEHNWLPETITIYQWV